MTEVTVPDFVFKADPSSCSKCPNRAETNDRTQLLVDCLKWYADPDNYVLVNMQLGNGQTVMVPGFGYPGPHKAQNILKAYEEQK